MNDLKQQAMTILAQAIKFKDLNKLVDLLIREDESVLIEILKQLKNIRRQRYISI